jgi:acetyltransferase-like isoleucine patch superfamily enzyme
VARSLEQHRSRTGEDPPQGYLPHAGFSPGCYIQANNGIRIGSNVLIGPGVKIISANHNLCDYSKWDSARPIEIGDNCWLSANCVLLPGVKLGDHVVVAAGAVVTKDAPDNCVVAGVPARVIRRLDPYRPAASDRPAQQPSESPGE